VTKAAGVAAKLSADGASLYYMKTSLSTDLWRIPLAGGPEQRVFSVGPIQGFAAGDKGIYFTVNLPFAGSGASLQFFDFATRRFQQVYASQKPVFDGLEVAEDGSALSYSQLDRAETGLMVADGFQ
jgi:hypothetical protein